MLSNQSHAGDDFFDHSKPNEKFEWCNVEKLGWQWFRLEISNVARLVRKIAF